MFVKVVHYDPNDTPNNESLYECKTVHFPASEESIILETDNPIISAVTGTVVGREIVDFMEVPENFYVRIFVMNNDGKTIDSRRYNGR